MTDVQREISSLADLIRASLRAPAVIGYDHSGDISPVESLRRRKNTQPQHPLVDIG